MEQEIWKNVISFEGKYQVSNVGRVRSLDWVMYRGNGRSYTNKGRILKPAESKDGYLKGAMCVDKKMFPYCVHKLVASAFCYKPPHATEVNHINSIKTDNRAANLEWCNRSENILHNMRSRGIDIKWTEENLSLLGTMPDYRLAQKMGCNKKSVMEKRRECGIKSYAEQTGNTGQFIKKHG